MKQSNVKILKSLPSDQQPQVKQAFATFDVDGALQGLKNLPPFVKDAIRHGISLGRKYGVPWLRKQNPMFAAFVEMILNTADGYVK